MNLIPDAFTAALAHAGDQPETSFAALGALADSLVGAKLFTLMTFAPELGEARRIFSNMPGAYPVSGTKPVEDNLWSRHVLERHQVFVGNDIAAIAEVFPDFELIQSLGCESVINVPAVVGGRVLGTINCLDAAGHYTQDRIDAAEALKLPGAICFLLHSILNQGKGK
ncbi:MAG: GAF domain-containing protein [Alphaproteobacteria bacterium]